MIFPPRLSELERMYADETHDRGKRFPGWNPWADLRERLAWAYPTSDPQTKFTDGRGDLMKWRKLGCKRGCNDV